MGDTVVAAAIAAQAATISTAIGSGSAAVSTAITGHATSLTAYDAAKESTLTGLAATQMLAYSAQLVIYYNAAKDSVDDRDAAIDDQVSFMQYLQNTKVNVDLPMVEDKVDVLTLLNIPVLQQCGSGSDVKNMTFRDGLAIDDTSSKLSKQACGSVPNNWYQHAGRLSGAKSGSYAYGIVSNADVRRVERFRKNKTSLVRQAHLGTKSIYNAGDVLSRYAQVVGVHSGLADLYIQGFNSAGAGLGVALGKLSTGTGQGSGDGVSTNPAGSGNSQTGPMSPPSP